MDDQTNLEEQIESTENPDEVENENDVEAKFVNFRVITPTGSKLDIQPVNDLLDDSTTNEMDKFLDEVFGGDLSTDLIIPPASSATGLESELGDIIRSSFPDINQLKSLIAKAGYLPPNLRGQMWSLLLTGSSTDDAEAEFWRCSGNEFKNQDELESDCNSMIESYTQHGSLTSSKNS